MLSASCDKPQFKQYYLSSFDKHNSYLPLFRGDYFSIEVFLHEDDHEWKLNNTKDIKRNNIIKFIYLY